MPATHECSVCGATYDETNVAAGNTRGLPNQDCIADLGGNQHQWRRIGMFLFLSLYVS